MKIDEIKRNAPISQIIGKDLQLKKQGHDHWCLCPFHGDKGASMQITDSKGIYYCYGCGAHGDVVDYLMNSRKVTFKEACAMLGGEVEAGTFKGAIAKQDDIDTYKDYIPLPPPPVAPLLEAGKRTPKLFNPKRAEDPEKKFVTYKPSMVFPYKTKDGELKGYVIRVDFEDGKKITPCIQWCKRPDGTEGWTHRPFMPLRSLYNLQMPATGQIFIAEGEKAADAVVKLLGVTCYTWAGGTNGVKFTDWSPLKGLNIVIWPDADAVGIKAAEEVAEQAVKAGAAKIKILYPPAGTLKGWDAADALDENWTRVEVMQWGKPNIKDYISAKKKDVDDTNVVDIKPKTEPEIKPAVKKKEKIQPHEDFKILGYNGGMFYYMPARGQQLVELSASQHSKQNLFQLAPLKYWEDAFPSKTLGIKWDHAASALIDSATRMGIFISHRMRRGRGAWIDEGRKVLHLGNRIMVDGKEYKPMDTPTNAVYEAAEPINIHAKEELSNKEAFKLIQICEAISWDNPLSGRLMAGLCVIAPICGMLDWRPHAFITGESGSGKSTVIKRIITPMLGDFKIAVEGKTTEAGVRQRIKYDSIPIVFDEAESEDKHNAMRMQAIFDLARLASSGGEVLKGTVGGDGIAYSIRSMFIFSAINPAISHYADQTRITKFMITKDRSPNATENYEKLEEFISQTITQEYASKMMLRAFNHIETLLENIKIFTRAAVSILSEKRYADQLAPMLAGAYLCHSTKLITLEEAKRFIGEHDWGEHTAINAAKDGEKLLEAIMAYRVKMSDGHKWFDKTVGQMLVSLYTKPYETFSDMYREELNRTGIMQKGEYFYIANRSKPIESTLRETTWAHTWGQTLRTLSSTETTASMYFSPGIKCRATKLPMHMITDNEKAGAVQEDFLTIEEIY